MQDTFNLEEYKSFIVSKIEKRFFKKSSLTIEEKAATNRAKREGSKEGKQYTNQPKKLVSKTRRLRQD